MFLSPGSHTLQGYYSMRRPFFSEAELCPASKQFSSDIYSSGLTGKSLSCDAASMSGYTSLIDSYYPESFNEYRNAAHAAGAGTIFSPSALSTFLPPFSGDTSHFVLVRA